MSTGINYLPAGTHLQSDHFQLVDVLGQGGFGITYLAEEPHLSRRVAVKEFFPSGCLRQGMNVVPGPTLSPLQFTEAKQKFLEEVRVLARFRHTGIVQVHTHFEENQTGYMVMEFLRGKTLAQVVAQNGPLREKDAVRFIESIGQALSVVHKANIIHRDVKPENIMLCEDGHVVLIDFGLTKQEVADEKSTRRLTSSSAIGTEGYAPPEQYSRNTQFAPTTDIYALGATLYFLLTGEAPLSAIQRAAGEELPALHEQSPHLSPTVSQAVAQAMAMPVKNRPAQVELFMEMLHGGSPSSGANTGSPLPTAVGLQKLSAAHQRAQAALKKWQEALQTVQLAEQTAQHSLPLPDRLTVGVEEAKHQLQHADWALLVGIEKEGEGARDEVITLAKNELQQEGNRRRQSITQIEQELQALEQKRRQSVTQITNEKEPLVQAALQKKEAAKRQWQETIDNGSEVGGWTIPCGCLTWFALAAGIGIIRDLIGAMPTYSGIGILAQLATLFGWVVGFPLAVVGIRMIIRIYADVMQAPKLAEAERQIQHAENNCQEQLRHVQREFDDSRQSLKQQLMAVQENKDRIRVALKLLADA